MMPATKQAAQLGQRDLAITLLALLSVLAWDFSGLDLPLARLFGSADGFHLREAWLTSHLLHEGGRGLAWLLLIWQGLHAFALKPLPLTPPRRERRYWLGVAIASIVFVPALKRVTMSSCPWELSEFGGVASYVPHWLLGVYDGGPGHCFPSGHAIAAFGFFGLYFLWRPYRPVLARTLLGLVLAFGPRRTVWAESNLSPKSRVFHVEPLCSWAEPSTKATVTGTAAANDAPSARIMNSCAIRLLIIYTAFRHRTITLFLHMKYNPLLPNKLRHMTLWR